MVVQEMNTKDDKLYRQIKPSSGEWQLFLSVHAFKIFSGCGDEARAASSARKKIGAAQSRMLPDAILGQPLHN